VCLYVCLCISKGTEGMLPLHVACLHGSQCCLYICLCISKGTEGMLPLHVACLHGSRGCLEVLIDVMSTSQIIKSTDDFGRSALHAAALSTCVSILLSSSGAGSNLKVEGHNFRRAALEKFFLLCPSTFSWCPGHFGKVQGTVT